MNKRDQEIAERAVADMFAHNGDSFTTHIDAMVPYIAAARAEGDQAGYERGKREAIEECAQWIVMECDLKTADALKMAADMRRALAEPTIQQDDNGESA